MSQAWSKLVFPALGRQKLKDHKFEDTLGYIDGKCFKDRKIIVVIIINTLKLLYTF